MLIAAIKGLRFHRYVYIFIKVLYIHRYIIFIKYIIIYLIIKNKKQGRALLFKIGFKVLMRNMPYRLPLSAQRRRSIPVRYLPSL